MGYDSRLYYVCASVCVRIEQAVWCDDSLFLYFIHLHSEVEMVLSFLDL